jgi:serine/threonine-protein kinase RsbW
MHTSAARARALRTSGVTYPGSMEYVSAVRADLRALLPDCPMADDVILCASELAANAALHSDSCMPGGTFTVRAAVHSGCHVRVEVEDNGGPWVALPSHPGGRHGLDIVRALASELGINGNHAARIIWARFDWSE